MLSDNNRIVLQGTILEDVEFSHSKGSYCLYTTYIAVKRLSGVLDKLPITIREDVANVDSIHKGQRVKLIGQIRTYNKIEGEKSRLKINVYVTEIEETKEEQDINKLELEGHICREPIYRITPLNREITDTMIAINRTYTVSDYIPCIVWGNNAKLIVNVDVGSNIKVKGRLQSRTYIKKYEDGSEENRVAYEVSISKFDI